MNSQFLNELTPILSQITLFWLSLSSKWLIMLSWTWITAMGKGLCYTKLNSSWHLQNNYSINDCHDCLLHTWAIVWVAENPSNRIFYNKKTQIQYTWMTWSPLLRIPPYKKITLLMGRLYIKRLRLLRDQLGIVGWGTVHGITVGTNSHLYSFL